MLVLPKTTRTVQAKEKDNVGISESDNKCDVCKSAMRKGGCTGDCNDH